MADLLFHFATAHVPGRALRDGRVRSILYMGVCLPDVLYKAFLYLGGAPTWLCEPTHSPLGLIAICYAGSLLFEEEWRKRAFTALLAGSWIHLAADAAKDYMGMGVIPWAFPFSMDLVELGWYEPEGMIHLMLPALAIILAVEIAARLLRRKAQTV